MCKLTKNLPIQGVLDFQDSGWREIQGPGGWDPRRSYTLGHLKYSGHILCTHSMKQHNMNIPKNHQKNNDCKGKKLRGAWAPPEQKRCSKPAWVTARSILNVLFKSWPCFKAPSNEAWDGITQMRADFFSQNDGMFLIVEISFDRRLQYRSYSKRTRFSFSSKNQLEPLAQCQTFLSWYVFDRSHVYTHVNALLCDVYTQ